MRGRRIARKRMCACLVPYAGMGSSYTACCLSVPVRVKFWDSRDVDYPASWRSCAPITSAGSGSKHRALLGNEVCHAGRASPKLWGAAATLLGDKCQDLLDDWGPSCWQGDTRCQACTQVLHLNLTPQSGFNP